MDVKIEASWKEAMKDEFSKPYFAGITLFLKKEKADGQVVYPPGSQIFNAFNTTPLPDVKVVILGQDPYHGPGQANGLCFSVSDGIPPPPSLVNIFKELHADLQCTIPRTGNLMPWAKQGVFLLNASLTVRAGQPMSHAKIGWAEFTNSVIKKISDTSKHVVFLLWGKFAQDKSVLIDESKHHILKSAHPSPLSAHNGFLGNKHFSKTNAYLKSKGLAEINWQL
jgi:uracil-DNA glycosylase